MKTLLSALVITLCSFAASAQTTAPQDTTKKTKQNSPSPAKNKSETGPVINRIAVSDPGMPAEKDTASSKRSGTAKPAEKKKSKSTKGTPR